MWFVLYLGISFETGTSVLFWFFYHIIGGFKLFQFHRYKSLYTCNWPQCGINNVSLSVICFLLFWVYRRHINFRGHNILWVKFSQGQIFVGGGSPRKFNLHENYLLSLVVHETRMARREEDVEYQKTHKAISLRYRHWGYPWWQRTIRIWHTIEWTQVLSKCHCRSASTVIPYVANYSLA